MDKEKKRRKEKEAYELKENSKVIIELYRGKDMYENKEKHIKKQKKISIRVLHY